MECVICLISWDCSEHIPRLLSCGHTFCQICLLSIFKKAQSNQRQFFCPTCNSVQNITKEEDIYKLIKNYNLLELMEKHSEEEEENLKKLSNKKRISTSLINLLQIDPIVNENKTKTKNGETTHNDDNLDLYFDIDNRCIEHNLPLHSYAVGTNLLFCDECIKDSKMACKLLPNVEKDLYKRIDSSLYKACILKNQILLLQNFFESYLIEFDKTNTNKIDKLFKYFEQVITYFKNKVKQSLTQCISKQKNNINIYLKKMENINNELTKIEEELTNIGNIKNINLFLKKIDNIRNTEK